MKVNPHMAPPPAHFGAPLDSARMVVILVHGRTQTPEDMDQHIVRRLDLPGVAYIAPRAADRTWYPASFLAPLEQNEPNLTFALERVCALSDDLAAYGVPQEHQVLMGFSQGGCLLCELVYRERERRRFGALIAFTGGLIGPPGIAWNAAAADLYQHMPILLGGPEADQWVPAHRMADTAAVFTRLGAKVDFTLYPALGHEVGTEQIARARQILTSNGRSTRA